MTTQLNLQEAVELTSAWLQDVARKSGIRSLTIKGDTLARFGLRAPRVSADVDVLIEPDRFEEFVSIVRHLGWEPFPSTFQSVNFTTHSVTLQRAGWPNSIDIHRDYPGFLRPPLETFDVLWGRRTSTEFAHRSCDVPDRMSCVLVLALHSLRSIDEDPRHTDELAFLHEAGFSDAERADIASIAEMTGSAMPLKDFLAGMGIAVEDSKDDLASEAYRTWRWKVIGAQGDKTDATAAEWVAMFFRVGWRDKPRVAYRGLWPTRSDILANNPEVSGWWQRVMARAARLRRGARAIRSVVRRHRSTTERPTNIR